MKNKKVLFGIIIFLFAITGIYSIQNVSAFTDTIYVSPSSYAWYYMGYLETDDYIRINKITSNAEEIIGGGINVIVMDEGGFNEFQDSDGDSFYYEEMWDNVVQLSYASIKADEAGDYYVVLANRDGTYGRDVYVDIEVIHPIIDKKPKITFWNILTILITISIIASAIVIPVVIVHKRKKRISEEVIKPIE